MKKKKTHPIQNSQHVSTEVSQVIGLRDRMPEPSGHSPWPAIFSLVASGEEQRTRRVQFSTTETQLTKLSYKYTCFIIAAYCCIAHVYKHIMYI